MTKRRQYEKLAYGFIDGFIVYRRPIGMGFL
jgi:hypothetical protein